MPNHLARYVEQICNQGCDAVRHIIDSLEQQQPVNITRELSPTDREMVLHELKEIMSVYDRQ